MTVADVYRALWRRRLLIAVLTLALVAADAFVTAQQTKLYTASSLVRVEQKTTTAADQFGSLQTGALLARTYARIAESSTVADLVKAQLGQSVPASAIKIKAAQVSDVDLLELSATNANPALAARIANAVPGALITLVKQSGPSPDVITTIDHAAAPTSPSSPEHEAECCDRLHRRPDPEQRHRAAGCGVRRPDRRRRGSRAPDRPAGDRDHPDALARRRSRDRSRGSAAAGRGAEARARRPDPSRLSG